MGLKQRVPFLRWSVLRFALAMPGFSRTGQIGDGREAATSAYVEVNARAGDVDDVRAYLPDLFAILDRNWLHRESIVVADNVRIPGAPKYRAYMREQQGKLFDTVEHKTHVGYQTMLSDFVLESEYLAG